VYNIARKKLKWLRGLMQSDYVCIRPYSLNTTIAFYFVNECSNNAVCV